jgi:stearoyl-CoA desaturase (delta-9 desaturase)
LALNIFIALLAGLLIMQLANLTTTVYLHRSLTHKALTLRAPLAWFSRLTTWLTTGIRPRQWVAVHRKHHAHTDDPQDPHSPLILGWKRVLFFNVPLYRRAAADPENLRKYAKDLPRTTVDRIFFDRALVGLTLGTTFLILVLMAIGLPWWVGVLAAAIHAATYLLLGGAVNGIGHTFGKRPDDNTGTNLQSLALLTVGEGLHNNHHAAPTAAKFSFRRSEFDPGWVFISVAAKLKLARVRHSEPKPKRQPIAA